MKSSIRLAGALGALGLGLGLSAGAIAATHTLRAGDTTAAGTALAPLGTVLFDTLGGVDPVQAFVVTSQSFGLPTPFDTFETFGADDFTVTGNGWTINAIQVQGSYYNAVSPPLAADSVNVYILADSAGQPAGTNLPADALFAWEGAPYTDVQDGDLRVDLPAPGWFLAPGTYWLVFQPNVDGTQGQWGWTESSAAPQSGTAVGFESVWMQVSPALIPPGNCADAWSARVTVCGATQAANPPPEPDFAFVLEGTLGVPGIAVSPLAIETSEPDVVGTFDIVLEAPPQLGETVTIPLDDSAGALLGTAPASVVFGGGNWDVPQTVTVTPVDDSIPGEDPAVWTLALLPAVSGDPGYAGIDPPDVTVTHFDDDTVLAVPALEGPGMLLLAGLLAAFGVLTVRRTGS